MRISFFFPAYNDEATVEPLALALDEVLDLVADDHEIIIVDDGGPDHSGARAAALAARHPRVRVIHHPENRGYGQALWSGIQAARFEWIGFTDGDMQYDVQDLPRLVRAARAGADVIAGYKLTRAEGFKRAAASYIYNRVLGILFGLPLRDVDCAFKLMHRRVFDGFVPSTYYREAFLLVEAFYRARARGLVFVEVPVRHRERPHGDSQCFTWRTTGRLAYYTARGAVIGRLLGRWR